MGRKQPARDDRERGGLRRHDIVALPVHPKFLSRERTVAGQSFNRWLVPPAALAIHLCIGMAYGFSVFWLPLSRAVGISAPKVCAEDMGFFAALVQTGCDWKISSLVGPSRCFSCSSSSAAVFGHWLETAGPRRAGLASALCWCGGLLISAAGVYLHQIWMLWLGSGVIGGIGWALATFRRSTLIKWFPDRRGMATGLAIMGFGGGAMIGAPLADKLMASYATTTSVGVWQTFVTIAAIDAVFMVAGALSYRVPSDGWRPEGWTPPAPAANAMVTHRTYTSIRPGKRRSSGCYGPFSASTSRRALASSAWHPQCLQEVFGGRLIGLDIGFER